MGLKLNAANGGGSVELDVPSTVNSDLALTVPAAAGELAVKDSSGNLDIGGKLMVATSTPSGYADRQLTVGDTSLSSSNIEIRCATNGWGGISFSDSTAADVNSYRGTVEYNHTDNYMQFRTNAVVGMQITSEGYVTKSAQPGFSASDTRGWNTQTNTTLVFNSPTWNTGIHYSTSTGRFTAPIAGKYLVMCNMYIDNSSGNFNTGTLFKVNGNTYSPAGSAAPYQQVSTGGGVSGDTTNGWTDIINLGANDYIEWVANGSIKYYMKHCTIGAYLLG